MNIIRTMNTIDVIVCIVLFIVCVVLAVLIANTHTHTYLHTMSRGGYVGGFKNKPQQQKTLSVSDPRDVEKNLLYSPITHNNVNYTTKNNKYVLPNTDKQITTVLQNGGALALGNLIEVLSKRTNNITGLLSLLGKTGELNDSEVYEFLSDINPTGVDVSADMKRGESMARHYHMHTKHSIGSLPSQPKYLDLGGKEGGITLAFAKHINARDIHVVEVDKYDTPGINYHIVSEGGEGGYKLPYDDDSFDVISAFMVLHHVKNLPSMISEVLRVLKPAGKLVIADHDCWDAFDAMLIDIEHLIYMVGKEGFNVKKDEWYMRYFNRGQLTQLLSPLKLNGGGYVSGAKPETAANRKFWSVYSIRANR